MHFVEILPKAYKLFNKWKTAWNNKELSNKWLEKDARWNRKNSLVSQLYNYIGEANSSDREETRKTDKGTKEENGWRRNGKNTTKNRGKKKKA